jgi:hypothetical protein
MEEGESLVGVTVVVVVVVVVMVVMVVLLSHESLAEETTTTTTLPNYQPLLPPFFFFLFFFGLCSPIFHRQTQELMQISTLHNFPETNPKNLCKFQNFTIFHR